MKQNTVLQEQVTEEQSQKVTESQEQLEHMKEELVGEKKKHEEQVNSLLSQVQELRNKELQIKEQNRSKFVEITKCGRVTIRGAQWVCGMVGM